ncbi:MAG: Mu-like prophage major head subunit gpT family protein [Azospirillaceae bacterium]
MTAATLSRPMELDRRAPAAPRSLDREARTVEVVASSGAEVQRGGVRPDGSYGAWRERLDVRGVDTSRFTGGPVLTDHRREVDGVVGSIETARVRDGVLTARLRFRENPAGDDVLGGIADGSLSQVSVGYAVREWEVGADGDRENPQFTATEWAPLELSIVAIGADPAARVRSHEGSSTMADQQTTAAEPGGDTTTATRDGGAEAERQRADQIRTSVRAAKLGEEFADRLIRDGVSVDKARAQIIDAWAEQGGPDTRSGIRVEGIHDYDAPEAKHEALVDALVARMAGREPTGPAQRFRGIALSGAAQEVLEMRGERLPAEARFWNGARRSETILKRAFIGHTTADFPALMLDAMNKRLEEQFAARQSPLMQLARISEAPDFRKQHSIRHGHFPRLQKVVEGAEIKRGTMADTKESFAIATWAGLFGLSRQALANDDLGAINALTNEGAIAAANEQSAILVSLLTANSGDGVTLEDGDPLYDTGRGNKASSGGAITVDNLSTARQAMRTVKGLDGVTPIDAAPRHLLVSPDKETEAEQVLATLQANTVGEVNPFPGTLQLHVDPWLSGNSWRLFTDRFTVIEAAYLGGNRGPMIDTKDGWDILGTEFRVVLDFGAGIAAGGEKGTYLNSGD